MNDFFAWIADQFNKTLITQNRYMLYIEGLLQTIIISLGAIALGVLIGTIFAVIKYLNKRTKRFKIIVKIVDGIVFVVRGTPVVLQLMLMVFVILAFMHNGTIIAIITFGINSGAYVSEILRGGLEGVELGQYEAGRALGLNMRKTLMKIIVPQAIKTSIPAFFNEFIALIKETSVVGYIAIADVTFAAYRIQSRTMDAFFPLIVSAVIYLILVAVLTFILRKIERRLSKNER